jgi:hypothetical protein
VVASLIHSGRLIAGYQQVPDVFYHIGIVVVLALGLRVAVRSRADDIEEMRRQP